MHRATYERLHSEVVELERAEDEATNAAVASGELSFAAWLRDATARRFCLD